MRRFVWAAVVLAGCGGKPAGPTVPTAADLQVELTLLDRLEKDRSNAQAELDDSTEKYERTTDSLKGFFDESSRQMVADAIDVWMKDVKRLEPHIESLGKQIAEQRSVVERLRNQRKSAP